MGIKPPKTWSIEPNPLWQPSESEQATTRKTIAETDQIYYTMNAATSEDIAESRWGGDTYSSDMHIDIKARKAQAEAATTPGALEDIALDLVEYAEGACWHRHHHTEVRSVLNYILGKKAGLCAARGSTS